MYVKGKGKDFHAHCTKAYGGSGLRISLILRLKTTWRKVVNRNPRPLYTRYQLHTVWVGPREVTIIVCPCFYNLSVICNNNFKPSERMVSQCNYIANGTQKPTRCCGKRHAVFFQRLNWVLGAFAKLRKSTINFVMSVSLSVHMEQLGFHCTVFYEI
jgi:hypothetical protein